VTLRPGLILAAVFLCVYGTFALVVNLPKATVGFKSDEATYYMMGLSLVHDWDLTYRKEDLVRVWREFPAGPAGVFLKRGTKIGGAPDPDTTRLFYGKSFIYPRFATPLLLLFGTNGFLVLNALALALVLLAGYLFLHARSGAWPSALFAGGFVMASVVPVYFVQMMPEVFNFSLACLAYFCWLYKEVAARERTPRGTAWLFTGKSDLACAILLGIATFSKPTIAALFAAPVLWWIFRLKAEATGIKKGAACLATFALVAGGLFAVNTAITGEWNYQGGGDRRKSYIFEFPFQTEGSTNQLGVTKSRETAMTQVILNPRTFTSNLVHNLEYFFIGRYAGLLGYFFPGVFAMLALLAAPRKRPLWQWLVLGSALAQGLIFVFLTPYTWSGGGVGNRYFFAGYGVMLFLLPPIESVAAALTPWAIGGLFVAPMILNPFVASFQPNENAKAGPLRLLPVELTLLNDLPVWTEGDGRARLWFGEGSERNPSFLVSLLDDNAYGREEDGSFWTRGDSRADIVFKADKPIRRAVFMIAAGPVPVDVTIRLGGRRHDVHVEAHGTQQISASMPDGVIFEKEVQGVRLWNVVVTTKGGFTPIFYDMQAKDSRYLGARIKPILESRPQ
jgi:hypothetical protein